MKPFRYPRTAAFADSDAAGVIHFSRLLCFVEEAEHAWLAAQGMPVDLRRPEALHWPRAAVQAEFLGAAYPGEALEVVLTLSRRGARSLHWTWEIVRGAEPLARGTLVTVCCLPDGQGGLRSVPLPMEA